MVFATNSSDRLTIDSSGNVGVGTSSPTQRLHVDGGSSLIKSSYDATGTTNVYQYFATRASGNWRNSTIGNTGNALVFGTGGTGTTHTNATERMRITSDGKLGIGTTAPDEKLQVNGKLKVSSYFGTGTAVIIQNNDSSDNYSAAAFYSGGTVAGYIFVNGSLNSTSYQTTSDYRVKENINYDFDALDRVKQLKPARFNFIADETNTLVDGFLAHEVSDIVPEAISGEKDGEQMQGIDQSKLVPLLTKAIQEQQEQIEALQSEINTLKGGE